MLYNDNISYIIDTYGDVCSFGEGCTNTKYEAINPVEKTVDISNTMTTRFDDCIYCMECVNNCPENALSLKEEEFNLRSDLCSGLGCLRCVRNCKQNAFKYNQFYKK